MDQVKIGAFIAALRREKNMTQAQLGECLGVSQRAVSRWETGRNMPDLALLPELCRVLEVNIAELLDGERIEGEQLTKSDATRLAERLIALVKGRRSARRLLGAALSLVLTVTCMTALYRHEFDVRVESTAELEAAIDIYHEDGEMRADVLERLAIGRRLFVLYEQSGCPGAGGLCCLERGLFGRYRMVSARDFDDPLHMVEIAEVGGRYHLLSFAVCDLPGVAAFTCTGERKTTAYTGEAVTTVFPFPRAPFLQEAEIPKDVAYNLAALRYFDGDGNEIDRAALESRFPAVQGADKSSRGTAELGLVYVWEGLLLALGAVFLRYFLRDA